MTDPNLPDYYVTAIDSMRRVAFLAGPFAHKEAAADAVEEARELAYRRVGGPAHWWEYGTARLRHPDLRRVGVLNADLGLPTSL